MLWTGHPTCIVLVLSMRFSDQIDAEPNHSVDSELDEMTIWGIQINCDDSVTINLTWTVRFRDLRDLRETAPILPPFLRPIHCARRPRMLSSSFTYHRFEIFLDENCCPIAIARLPQFFGFRFLWTVSLKYGFPAPDGSGEPVKLGENSLDTARLWRLCAS